MLRWCKRANEVKKSGIVVFAKRPLDIGQEQVHFILAMFAAARPVIFVRFKFVLSPQGIRRPPAARRLINSHLELKRAKRYAIAVEQLGRLAALTANYPLRPGAQAADRHL